MKRDALTAAVWDELPAMKHLIGRRRVERVIGRTIDKWPVPVLCQCDAGESEVVGKYLARSVERAERAEYGMGFFASIILASLISEIVKIMLRRWLENRTAMMEACQ